ncbi:MAG: hypothetical protein ACLRQA_09080, partial [Anaerovoracaceae bacterium]
MANEAREEKIKETVGDVPQAAFTCGTDFGTQKCPFARMKLSGICICRIIRKLINGSMQIHRGRHLNT